MNRALSEAAGIGDSVRVRILLDRGASASGDVLRQAPGAESVHGDAAVAVPARSSAPLSPREAVARSLPGLQHADVVFLKTAGCVSCHNNSLFQMTATLAQSRGFRIDEPAAAAQLKVIGAYIESWRERLLQDIPIPGAVDTVSFMLAGLADVHYPADAGTDAMARYLLRRQDRDGGWRIATSSRPPIESSNFAA
ncbi:MAG TPA: hypothetical protein VFF43_16610, partial [Caldimonas sp.]|nr:hypothetical protein [Caldimonas sp.]